MLIIRELGNQDYLTVLQRMQAFTRERTKNTPDELWIVEHPAVYTQGQAGKPEHVLNPNAIDVIQSDRGGQITYHGPGQLIAYVLFDINRRRIGIRTLVHQLEVLIMDVLASFDIIGHIQSGAPGVYVQDKKIASIGLRVRQGCTYHGVALNVAMDLSPFLGINPCGYSGLVMTQMQDFVPDITPSGVTAPLTTAFNLQFGQT
ncbi:MAG: octanoyltransferase [Legionella sp. 21-45-4]|nr:MAG: octanoyltransferase [Legionella sp. 21-45-4]